MVGARERVAVVPRVKTRVSIVIPTLREYAFGKSLDRLIDHLRGTPGYAYEIVVVDDSDFETQAMMSDLIALRQDTAERADVALRFVPGPRKGKGAAVRLGAQRATGAVVFIIDADLPVPLENVGGFLDAIEAGGADVVVAERPPNRYPGRALRHVLSRGLALIQKGFVFHGSPFEDTQCGFKAFRADALRYLTERQLVDRGMYDLEYLYAAGVCGLAVQTVAVERCPEIRPSRINLLSCVLLDPIDIVHFKVRGVLGHYA
jgi:glycosyltransferase involved in cell wall biosynthesis